MRRNSLLVTEMTLRMKPRFLVLKHLSTVSNYIDIQGTMQVDSFWSQVICKGHMNNS